MADEKYDQEFFLALAAKGKEVWNAWRRDPDNKDVRVTFAGVDFSEAPRNEIDFSGFEFGDYADFSRCKWRGSIQQTDGRAFVPGRACFTGAVFGYSADFTGAAAFGPTPTFACAVFGDLARFDGAVFGYSPSSPTRSSATGPFLAVRLSTFMPTSPARPSVFPPASAARLSVSMPTSPALPSVTRRFSTEPISEVALNSRGNGLGTWQTRKRQMGRARKLSWR